MNGFTYYDIFETKGIEYIIIIAFLIILIPFWLIINRKGKAVQKIKQQLGVIKADILKIPRGIFYNKNHTWAHIAKSGIAEVGLDDLLLHLTGKVEIKNFKEEGENINKGELLMEIKNEGKTLKIVSPISGIVQKTNPQVDLNSKLIEDDPYNEGWLYKIEPSNWRAESNSFYFGDEANKWFIKELDRFKDFVAISSGKNLSKTPITIMQEGGELRDHPLEGLPSEIWKDFQKEFLDV